MNKLLGVVLPFLGIALLIMIFMGYSFVTAKGGSQLTDKKLLEDKAYFAKNQDMYGDCQYTVEGNDFSTATVTSKYYYQGISIEKLESLEAQFKDKYKQQCQPLLDEYRQRYELYKEHQLQAASVELSQLDKWFGKEPQVLSDPSPIMRLYQEYDPKSLQHPTNPDATILYTPEDYDNFVKANL